MNNKTALQIARKTARNLGLTFKEENCYINGDQSYQLIFRDSGIVVSRYWTLKAVKSELENCDSLDNIFSELKSLYL